MTELRHRLKERIALVISTALLVLMLGACGGAGDSGETEEPTGSEDSGAVSVTDSSGEEVEVSGTPERIVCTTENCVDILSQLGVAPVAVLERNVEMAQDPRYLGDDASDVGTIGGSWFEPNLEDVIAAEPDLVIGFAGVQDALREPLEGTAPLFMVSPSNYEDAVQELEKVGKLVGREEQANRAVEEFRAKIEDYAERSPDDVTALVMYGSDANFGINTEQSMMGSVMAEIADYPWPLPEDAEDIAGGVPYSLEKVLEKDPDVIFVETLTFGDPSIDPLSEQLASNPLWEDLKAVREDRVYEVDEDVWHNGGGTRSLDLALDQAVSMLYPEEFPENEREG